MDLQEKDEATNGVLDKEPESSIKRGQKARRKTKRVRKDFHWANPKTIKKPKGHERDPNIRGRQITPNPLNQESINFEFSTKNIKTTIKTRMYDHIPSNKIALFIPKELKDKVSSSAKILGGI